MSLKRFNFQFDALASGKVTSKIDSEAHLQGLLSESIASIKKEPVTEYIEEIPTALSNITQLFTTCENNSVIYWKAVELIEKMIGSIKHRPNVAVKSGLMNVLVDILLRSVNKLDYLLELVEDLTFVITIASFEPYAQKLINFVINILTDDEQRNSKLQRTALSVLINICSRNADFLPLFSQEINLVDLHKKIPIEKYGILACKMNLVLHDCGHVLHEHDITNFLKYTLKDLSRFRSLDEKTLKHLIGFLKAMADRPNMSEIIKQFDFYSGLEAALQTINSHGSQSVLHINSILEVMQVLLSARNTSLKKMLVTVLNFALAFLKVDDCTAQVLETVNCVFIYDTKISTNNFEMDELCESLRSIMDTPSRSSPTTIGLLKVLSTLAKHYNNYLFDRKWLRSILTPLLQSDAPKYFKMHTNDVSVHLQCLAAILTLSECNPKEKELSVFNERSVQYLIGMAIKHGNADQIEVALSLINKALPPKSIAEVIASGSYIIDESANKENTMPIHNQTTRSVGANESTIAVGSERIKNIFHMVEKACLDGTLNNVPATDIIQLYRNEIKMHQNRIDLLSKEIMNEKQNTVRLEAMTLKWSEVARNSQESNEVLVNDKEKSNVIVRNLKDEVKDVTNDRKNTTKALGEERKRSRELEKRIQELEEEIGESEALHKNVMMLMAKRKKNNP